MFIAKNKPLSKPNSGGATTSLIKPQSEGMKRLLQAKGLFSPPTNSLPQGIYPKLTLIVTQFSE
jgi:hypothetical protein